jgi:hypothetical protein
MRSVLQLRLSLRGLGLTSRNSWTRLSTAPPGSVSMRQCSWFARHSRAASSRSLKSWIFSRRASSAMGLSHQGGIRCGQCSAVQLCQWNGM